MSDDLLLALTPETLRWCLASLRATELCAGLAACCQAMRRACQHSEFWRAEAQARFPELVVQGCGKDGRLLSWRATLVSALWIQHSRLRERCLASAQRLRTELQEAQARRAWLLGERESSQTKLEGLGSRLKCLRQQAASADSFRTSHQSAMGSSGQADVSAIAAGPAARRAKAARCWAEVDETRVVISEVEAELRSLQMELAPGGRAGVEQLRALGVGLASREATIRKAETSLARLPSIHTTSLTSSRASAAAAEGHLRASSEGPASGSSRLAAAVARAGERAASSTSSSAVRDTSRPLWKRRRICVL